MEVALSYLTQKLIRFDDVKFDSSTCKGLAGRAAREATVFFEPLLVLRKVSTQPEFSNLGHKFCSVPVLTFLKETKAGDALAPTASSLCVPVPVEETKGGDDERERDEAQAMPPATTANPTVPDAVAAKVWAWIKTTRELKKVRTLAAACNAIAFLCRCRGYGLVWGDEVEAELEATLKEALADVNAARGKQTAVADATWVGCGLEDSRCARVVVTGFDDDPNSLKVMLEDELTWQYDRRAEPNPIEQVRVSRSSSTSFDVTAVLRASMAFSVDKTSSEADLARALTNALRDRAGAGSSPLATLQARLQAAVEALRLLHSTSYKFTEVLCPTDATRGVYGTKIIGCFIGKGGANIKKLKADLAILHPQVDVSLCGGVVTVTVGSTPEKLEPKLKADLHKLLNRAVAVAKTKGVNPCAKYRERRFRSTVRLPHLIQLASPFDYAWGKKTARMQRYNCERKVRKAYTSPRFKGVVQDFDMDSKTHTEFEGKNRKERNVSRCETKRQQRRARQEKIAKQHLSRAKKSVTKNRSRARSSKLNFGHDFIVAH